MYIVFHIALKIWVQLGKAAQVQNEGNHNKARSAYWLGMNTNTTTENNLYNV